MKRTLLFSGLFISLMFWAGVTFAQCTPDPTVTDPEGNGEMVPDTLEAWELQTMNTTLTIICPASAVVSGNTIYIHHIENASITNKPAWMSYACVPATCEYMAGQLQCALVTGTPPAGEDTIAMDVLVDVWVDWGPPIGILESYTNYNSGNKLVLIIHPQGWGTKEYSQASFDVIQNQPNPFSKETRICYKTNSAESLTLKVVDLLGNLVCTENMITGKGENFFNFTGSELSSGIYFYTIMKGNDNILTRKMIKTD